MFLGIHCAVCGKSIQHVDYRKEINRSGQYEGLYWFNPTLSDLHDSVVNFCGAEHSTEWHMEKVAVRSQNSEKSQN